MRFTFGSEFTLRTTEETDFALAQEWNAADPWHRHTTQPEFWLDNNAGADSYLLEDAIGPVFFFKLMQTNQPAELEMHIQFSPDKGPGMGLRTIRGLVTGFAWLERRLSGLGYEAVYFDSKSPTLINFCKSHLRFEDQDGRLKRTIPKISTIPTIPKTTVN